MRRLFVLFWLVLALAGSSGLRLMAQTDLQAIAERMEVRYENVPRKVLAFYYPWYGNPKVQGGSGMWSHWNGVDEDTKQIASSTHYPLLGPYDSHDPKLIAQHCAWAKQSGVDGLIVSWWGKGSFSDRVMGRILDASRDAGIEVSIYYETVPRSKDAQAAAADVLYVLNRYGEHPAWLRADGKPVVFVYGRAVAQLGLKAWAAAISRINQEYPKKAVLLGDQMSRHAAAIFDGIHTYATVPALKGKTLPEVRSWAQTTYRSWVEMADAFGRISTITVMPGYDDTKIRKPGAQAQRMDGASYRCQWEEAVAADPHWILITSWNEWHEGSEIEPSLESGEQYLKLTAELAKRFKAQGRRASPPKNSRETAPLSAELRAKLSRIKIGLLPEAESAAFWSLLVWRLKPKLLSWEEVAGLQASSVKDLPVLVYAGGEVYRPTVKRPGDVDEALLRYLKAGGFLAVLPAGPMPFHYDPQRKVVAGSRKFGLPLSVGGPTGGWEKPPPDANLQFVQVGNRLPHLPATFPFPPGVDRRWRPFVRTQLAEGDVFTALLELQDGRGNRYGEGVAYVQYKAGGLSSGKVLYAWYGLLNSPYAEGLMADLLGLIAEQAGQTRE